jgi:hypothetical protein
MNFICTCIPGARPLAKAARALLRRPPAALPRPLLKSPPARLRPHPLGHWHVCPASGQLAQRWSLDDGQEPPGRGFAHRMQPAALMLGRFLGAHTFS